MGAEHLLGLTGEFNSGLPCAVKEMGRVLVDEAVFAEDPIPVKYFLGVVREKD